MEAENSARRIIQIQQNIIGPTTPRLKTVKARKISDFPSAPRVYLEVAKKLASPLLFGPQLCDELILLVQHMLTEEEANIIRLLGITGRTVEQLSHIARLPVDVVQPVLNRLALEKRVIASYRSHNLRKYKLLPLMPGVFEMCLVRPSEDSLTEWHRRFAELFEQLFETGYLLEHRNLVNIPLYRYLPIGKAIEFHSMALPTDKLEIILDEYDTFGVGICQCRLTAEIIGHGCGKPKLNCAVMGENAKLGIKHGWLKKVTKQEMLEIKREAESHGLVNWMMNVASAKSQSSCSCCGCCCHNFRIINEFNSPSIIAPPHFLPKFNSRACTYCGKCALNCPLGALIIDTKNKTRKHLGERCIGCGLCVVACGVYALSMEPVPDYKMPYKSWYWLLANAAPKIIGNSLRVWRERKF